MLLEKRRGRPDCGVPDPVRLGGEAELPTPGLSSDQDLVVALQGWKEEGRLRPGKGGLRGSTAERRARVNGIPGMGLVGRS